MLQKFQKLPLQKVVKGSELMARLGDYVEQIRGVSYKPEDVCDQNDSDAVAILRANNIQDDGLDFDDLVYVKNKKVSVNQYIKKGDIVVCASSGSKNLVGKASIAKEDLLMSFGAFCKVIRAKSILPEYLGCYFQSPVYRNLISDLAGGANINNIRNEHIDEIEINIPDICEQKVISEKINKVLSLILCRKKQLSKLDELVKARFIELFGDLKSNPYKWECKNLLDVADIDTVMVSDYEKYADYPHIGIDSIEKNTGRLVGYRTIAEDGVISGKYLFTDKHIIYSKIRPNLNKVALPDFDGLCSADAYPILPKENVCLRVYLGYVMRSEFFLDYILPFSRRANMPKVNKAQLSGFVLPVPDIATQNEFATFVEQVDKSKLVIQQSLDKLETMKKALMQKYFG